MDSKRVSKLDVYLVCVLGLSRFGWVLGMYTSNTSAKSKQYFG